MPAYASYNPRDRDVRAPKPNQHQSQTSFAEFCGSAAWRIRHTAASFSAVRRDAGRAGARRAIAPWAGGALGPAVACLSWRARAASGYATGCRLA